MSLVTINALPVHSMELHRPRIGAWMAYVDLVGSVVPSGPVVIEVGDGALRLVGTAQPTRSGTFAERGSARVVGGSNGLDTILPPRFYRDVPVRIPLVDLLTAAGESLSSTVLSSVLTPKLPRWVRVQANAYHALVNITTKTATDWRVLADGTIWIGVETWPVSKLVYELIDEDPVGRRLVIASEDPTLSPGVTLGGRKVSRVISTFAMNSVRSEVWCEL